MSRHGVEEVDVAEGVALYGFASAGARPADLENGVGVLKILASCSLATTGTGPIISETPKSRTNVCLNQDRSRWKKAGLWPRPVEQM